MRNCAASTFHFHPSPNNSGSRPRWTSCCAGATRWKPGSPPLKPRHPPPRRHPPPNPHARVQMTIVAATIPTGLKARHVKAWAGVRTANGGSGNRSQIISQGLKGRYKGRYNSTAQFRPDGSQGRVVFQGREDRERSNRDWRNIDKKLLFKRGPLFDAPRERRELIQSRRGFVQRREYRHNRWRWMVAPGRRCKARSRISLRVIAGSRVGAPTGDVLFTRRR